MPLPRTSLTIPPIFRSGTAAIPPARRGGRRPAVAFAAALAAILSAAVSASAQFTTPDCPDWRIGDFQYVNLISLATDSTLREPVRMAFDYRGGGKSDIYFAERHGKIKRWDAVENRITVLGELDVFSDDTAKPHKLPFAQEAETGINGLALDPGFKENGHIWVFYSPWADTVFRISRFTIADGRMDMASEKILFDIPEGRKHVSTITIAGGPLEFDADGNLWIAIGANSEQWPSVDERIRKRSAEASSSNLADLRGSILRVRPDGSPRGYSIPEGNFADYWSAEFARRGNGTLAQAYSDTAQVRPEIYVKGTRNPYSMSVDPATGWVVWGDFGPTQDQVEEINLNNRPAYAGYPYWAGRNVFVVGHLQPWTTAPLNPAAPVNNSVWNTGPRELPPAEPAVLAFSHEEANTALLRDGYPTSGPIYRYDAELDSPVKFPPHFDGAWMVTGRFGGMRLYKVNAAGNGVTDSAVFRGAGEPTAAWNRPIDLKQGPDGAIYLLEYHGYHQTTSLTHIGRYEYRGTCRPGTPIAARPGRKGPPRIRFAAGKVSVEQPGRHRLRIRDLQGREVFFAEGTGPKEYPLSLVGMGKGLFFATLEPGQGSWTIPGL